MFDTIIEQLLLQYTILNCSTILSQRTNMLGWLIRETVEITGKALGYAADEIGDIASAISDIPDTLSKAYNSTTEQPKTKDGQDTTAPTAD